MAKMNFTKIIRIRRVQKPNGGYNSLWLIRCNICGKIICRWDTDMYNRTCPICKNNGMKPNISKQYIKEEIFHIQNKLYVINKKHKVLTIKEIGLLSSFRETMFIETLEDLILNYWFLPKIYIRPRKKEYMINERGQQLLNNQDFIELLKLCYLLCD